MTLVEMVNPFTGKKAGEAPDEQHRPVVMYDPLVEKTVKLCHSFRVPADTNQTTYGHAAREKLKSTTIPLLSPAQINDVAQRMLPIENENEDYQGKFIDRLIQTSYDSGANDFTLVLPHYTSHCHFAHRMLDEINGTSTRPLQAQVCGARACLVGYACRHLVARISQSVDNCGEEAADSRFHVKGDAGEIGDDAKRTTFYVEGNAQYIGTNSTSCAFYVTGDMTDIENPMFMGRTPSEGCVFFLGGRLLDYSPKKFVNCTFKAVLPKTYDLLRKYFGERVTKIERMPTVEEAFK